MKNKKVKKKSFFSSILSIFFLVFIIFNAKKYIMKKNRIETRKIENNVIEQLNMKPINMFQIENNVIEQLNMKPLNMFQIKNIYFKMKDIKKNIFVFDNIISKYKNILFICGDYPGYGGSATNCDRLEKYYNNLGHNTYSFYFSFETEKSDFSSKYNIGNIKDIEGIKFKPDLILLKSFVKFDLKKKFKCPIYYLIGGIYKNNLDKYYYQIENKQEQEKYINKAVLDQIKRSDISFVNSYHTQKILESNYGLKTHLFYSSFIHYNIKENKFNFERKYEFGLIVSNFDRKIKNIEKSIEFLKNKRNVVLIGKNSSKYKNYGFECIDLVPEDKMDNFYSNIKYIVQDSYYESCSNVRIEGIMNGCYIIDDNDKKCIDNFCNQEYQYQKIQDKNQENFRNNYLLPNLIIISSTQYPGYGGAATNAYEILKYLRKKGKKVIGIFFNNKIDVNYDPDNIGGIYIYNYKHNKDEIFKDTLQYLGRYPEYCLAKNYKAPKWIKNIFPELYTVYLVSGINHFNLYYPQLSAKEFMDESFTNEYNNEEEIETNKLCEKIIVNSQVTYDIFKKIYPEFVYKLGKPLDTTLFIKKIDIKCFEKEYDIIMVCSNYTRPNKNNLFLIDVLSDTKIKDYRKLIIGEKSDIFSEISNTTCLTLQLHDDCINFLCKSKVLLYPSLYESNSNTIREAYIHNCLPLITENVGYSELFPEHLVCLDFSKEEWIKKINNLLINYNKYKNTNIKFNTSLSIDTFLNF